MKSIGIIGGMGPLATVDLYRKIIDYTDAASDGEHIRVVIDGNTRIPDRTRAILHGGESPVPELVRSAVGLEGMGADFLIMPCNTAHHFYDDLLPFVRVPILHMIRETLAEVRRQGIGCAGLLATDGTVRSGVYDSVFADSGITLLTPDAQGQAAVMDMIYGGVKAGKTSYNTAGVERAIAALQGQGAQTIILGCTELPLAFAMYGIGAPSVDPTATLARAAVALAKRAE